MNIQTLIQKHKTTIILTIIIIILITLNLYMLWLLNTNEEEEPEIIETKEEIKETKLLKVDIKGEIIHPGLYEVKEDSRVMDQTTPNMIQRIIGIFERKPLISKEI